MSPSLKGVSCHPTQTTPWSSGHHTACMEESNTSFVKPIADNCILHVLENTTIHNINTSQQVILKQQGANYNYWKSTWLRSIIQRQELVSRGGHYDLTAYNSLQSHSPGQQTHPQEDSPKCSQFHFPHPRCKSQDDTSRSIAHPNPLGRQIVHPSEKNK